MEAEISRELKRIRDKYVECSSCPPDNNCCDFNSKYRLNLPGKDMVAMIGEDNFRSLLRDRMVYQDQLFPERYFLEARCPNLKENNLCSIHDKKKIFGLDLCIKFPLYYLEGLLDGPTYRVCVVADFRCPSIQSSWKPISSSINTLVERFKPYDSHFCAYVRYCQDNRLKVATLQQMEGFIGSLPPQGFPKPNQ